MNPPSLLRAKGPPLEIVWPPLRPTPPPPSLSQEPLAPVSIYPSEKIFARVAIGLNSTKAKIIRAQI